LSRPAGQRSVDVFVFVIKPRAAAAVRGFAERIFVVFRDEIFLTARAKLEVGDDLRPFLLGSEIVLDGIEVLRGPQGTLFGKNVTGGAVLLRSRRPSDTFEGSARASAETGLEYKMMGSVSGPLTDNLKIRVSGYYDHDDGWFRNDFDNKPYGVSTTWTVRASLAWEPTDNLDVLLRFEHGDSSTDGLPNQNQAFNSRHSFDFNQDFAGQTDYRWNMLSSEINWKVGNGMITNVAGYRDLKLYTAYDSAGTPIQDFEISYNNPVRQFSNELRYAGRFFDMVDITAGLYYFTSHIKLVETRRVRTAANFASRSYGGVDQVARTYAAFAQADIDVASGLNLTLGGRYTYDKKRADIGQYSAAADSCDIPTQTCTYAFPNQKDHWTSFTPKIGVQYKISPDAQVYASWTKAYRAGGFNSRITAANQSLKWDQESTQAYEIGGKFDLFDRRLRINGAAYINKLKNLIRLVQTPGAAGVVSDTRNVGDATIKGGEVEVQAAVTDGLILRAFAGYQHGQYDKLTASLVNAPGEPVATVTTADLALKLVRLSPWSYGFGFTHTLPLSNSAELISRMDFNHRDRAASTDDNGAFLNAWNNLDGSVALKLEDRWTFTVFGRNLLNKSYSGLNFVIPNALIPPLPPGKTKAVVGILSEGRTIGFEASLKF